MPCCHTQKDHTEWLGTNARTVVFHKSSQCSVSSNVLQGCWFCGSEEQQQLLSFPTTTASAMWYRSKVQLLLDCRTTGTTSKQFAHVSHLFHCCQHYGRPSSSIGIKIHSCSLGIQVFSLTDLLVLGLLSLVK